VFDQTGGQVSLSILAFDDAFPRQPVEQGEVIFQASGTLMDISREIVNGVEAVLTEYGEEEYQRRWIEHPFPTETLEMVKGHLIA
jgi:hypothetical protein